MPIVILTGPPAVGKSTVARLLMGRFPQGLEIPVDDLREWVVSGRAEPVEWTDETTRQFRLAEEAAADVAVRYDDAGFAVVIDHCVGPGTLDDLIKRRFGGRHIARVVLLPSLEETLRRNSARTHKPFTAELLLPAIHGLHSDFSNAALTGWHVLDSTNESPEETAERVFGLLT